MLPSLSPALAYSVNVGQLGTMHPSTQVKRTLTCCYSFLSVHVLQASSRTRATSSGTDGSTVHPQPPTLYKKEHAQGAVEHPVRVQSSPLAADYLNYADVRYIDIDDVIAH